MGRFVLATILAALASASALAGPAGYAYRKVITINHAQVSGSSTLTNFPVLISITDANLQSAAQASGNDILFTAADGATKLNHEIESYASTTGQLVAWVNVPSVSPVSDTVIYMYYGNPSATPQQNAAGVWDANYKGVWHLGNGTILSVGDSTGLNSAVNAGATATAGQAGGAAALTQGSAQYVDAGGAPLNIAGATTLEAWVKYTGTFASGHFPRIISNLTGSSYSGAELLLHDTSAPDANTLYLQVGNGGALKQAFANAALSAGTVCHVVATYDGTTGKLYINGAAQTNTFSGAGAIGSSNLDTRVGSWPGSPAGNYWNGWIDEVRVSNVARSAAWIATEYNNQGAPGAFYTVGAQEGAGGTAVTVTTSPAGLSLTIDGAACAAPCSLLWPEGSAHTVAAATQPGGTGAQYVFASWSDGGAGSHTVTAPATATTYTATFTKQYYLTTTANPPAGGTITPASGWRDAGTTVTVTATPAPGYRFTNFSGALTGTATSQTLTMDAAVTVTGGFAVALWPTMPPIVW